MRKAKAAGLSEAYRKQNGENLFGWKSLGLGRGSFYIYICMYMYVSISEYIHPHLYVYIEGEALS